MAESNACMRRIVAAPTAGACGVMPAVLLPLWHGEKITQRQVIEALYTACGIGEVIAYNAGMSGASGGCQAEIGTAAAMAAGALVHIRGGDMDMICSAAAMALKNLMGLICDPVAGLVEVPCVKRNVAGNGAGGHREPGACGSGDKGHGRGWAAYAHRVQGDCPWRPCGHPLRQGRKGAAEGAGQGRILKGIMTKAGPGRTEPSRPGILSGHIVKFSRKCLHFPLRCCIIFKSAMRAKKIIA